MRALEQLSSHMRERPSQIARLKQQGTKVVGYFVGDYVPEELIYASGAVPLCLVHGGDRRAVDAALTATIRFLCPFSKAQYGEKALGEQPYYSMVDLLVAPITCQHLRKTADMWSFYTDTPVFRLGIPHEYDSDFGLEYYGGMLKMLKERLEDLTGNQIKDAKVREAIALYNRMRELLKEISLLRKAPRPPLSTLDFIKINHASCYADPAFMVEVLTSLKEELKESKKRPTPKEPRLLLIGPNIALGDYKVLELVEEAGGNIVIEELCEGVRYYWDGVEPNGDLIIALATKYLKRRMPCAFMRRATQKRFDYAMKLAKDFKVAGLLWYQLLYCDTYDIESYYFAQQLKEKGMPMLVLESDYDASDRGPLKTRIQAFLETLKWRS